jgi:hypothetical protein
MTTTRQVKTGGALLLIGGLLLAVMEIVTALAFPGESAAQAKEPLWTPAFALIVVGTMLLLFGLPVLYSRWAGPGGWMAQAGLVMVAIFGMALGVYGNLQLALILPWVASSDPAMLNSSAPTPPSFTVFYIVCGVVEVLGLAALSVPLLRGKLQPRWLGVALALAAVLGVLSFVTPSSMGSSNLGLSLLSAAPAVLVGIVFFELGRQLLMEQAPQSLPVPAEHGQAIPQN